MSWNKATSTDVVDHRMQTHLCAMNGLCASSPQRHLLPFLPPPFNSCLRVITRSCGKIFSSTSTCFQKMFAKPLHQPEPSAPHQRLGLGSLLNARAGTHIGRQRRRWRIRSTSGGVQAVSSHIRVCLHHLAHFRFVAGMSNASRRMVASSFFSLGLVMTAILLSTSQVHSPQRVLLLHVLTSCNAQALR